MKIRRLSSYHCPECSEITFGWRSPMDSERRCLCGVRSYVRPDGTVIALCNRCKRNPAQSEGLCDSCRA